MKSRDSKLVAVSNGRNDVETHRRVVSPASGVGGHGSRQVDRCATSAHLPKRGLATFPVLEVDRSETVAYPLVQIAGGSLGFQEGEKAFHPGRYSRRSFTTWSTLRPHVRRQCRDSL